VSWWKRKDTNVQEAQQRDSGDENARLDCKLNQVRGRLEAQFFHYPVFVKRYGPWGHVQDIGDFLIDFPRLRVARPHAAEESEFLRVLLAPDY